MFASGSATVSILVCMIYVCFAENCDGFLIKVKSPRCLDYKRGCEMLVLPVTFIPHNHLTSAVHLKHTMFGCSSFNCRPNVYHKQTSTFFVKVHIVIYCYTF